MQRIVETLHAKFLPLRIHRLGNSVGKHHQCVALVQLYRILLIRSEIHCAHHHILGFREDFYAAVGFEDVGRIVSGVAVNHLAGLDVVDAIEHRHKHTVNRIGGNEFVGDVDTFRRRKSAQTRGAYYGAAYRHKDSRRDALAAYVGDEEADAVAVQLEKVVKITSDVLRRCH